MAAFLQTILWVGLIVWALLRFEKAIGAVFAAVTKRIEDGDEVSAPGGLRIGARPTTQAEQIQRVQLAAREAMRSDNGGGEDGAEAVQPDRPQPEQQERPDANSLDGGQEPVAQNAGLDNRLRSNLSVRESLEVATRDVLDAQNFGLMWLSMMTGTSIQPSVTVGSVVFDGILVSPSGKQFGLAIVKLVTSFSHLEDIESEILRLAEGIKKKNHAIPLYVVLVKSESIPAGSNLWMELSVEVQISATIYEIDLSQLRSMYGLSK